MTGSNAGLHHIASRSAGRRRPSTSCPAQSALLAVPCNLHREMPYVTMRRTDTAATAARRTPPPLACRLDGHGRVHAEGLAHAR